MDTELPVVPLLEPPSVTFAEIPVFNQREQDHISFQADAMIRTNLITIGIANSISDSLLKKLHFMRN